MLVSDCLSIQKVYIVSEKESEKIISTQKLLETPRFTVHHDTVADRTGNTKNYYYLKKPDAVLIVAHTSRSMAVLKVRRRLIKGYSYELPGGRIEGTERPLEAAQRELAEETGLESRTWSCLASVYPLPSVTTERVHIFSARIKNDDGAILGPGAMHEGIADLEFMPFKLLTKLVTQNKITCSVDGYAVLLFYQNYFQNKGDRDSD